MDSASRKPNAAQCGRIVASIEARMTSTRLPGKVLKPLSGGKPMLQLLVERLRRSRYVDEVVVATTVNATDEPIASLCGKLGASVFRGSEEDVLGRVVGAVASVKGDTIVEVTGDCPLLDPRVVDSVIESYAAAYPDLDYVCNTGLGDLSRHAIPLGMDVQVFSYAALERVSRATHDPDDREHVSLYFYRDEGKNGYRTLNVPIPPEWRRDYPVRLTVDTPEDFLVIDAIYEAFREQGSDFSLADILKYCDTHPDVVQVNAAIAQRRPRGFRQV